MISAKATRSSISHGDNANITKVEMKRMMRMTVSMNTMGAVRSAAAYCHLTQGEKLCEMSAKSKQ